MKTNLIVIDPLAGQEVSILVTISAGEDGVACLSRDERPSLISVGVAGQMPITRSGILGDVTTLIHEAWTAFGVRAEVNEQSTKMAVSTQLSTGVSTQSNTAVAEELIAEAVVMTASDPDELPSTMSVTKPVTPKRPVSKLSLF